MLFVDARDFVVVLVFPQVFADGESEAEGFASHRNQEGVEHLVEGAARITSEFVARIEMPRIVEDAVLREIGFRNETGKGAVVDPLSVLCDARRIVFATPAVFTDGFPRSDYRPPHGRDFCGRTADAFVAFLDLAKKRFVLPVIVAEKIA